MSESRLEDVALKAFYEEHIKRVYRSPKKQAEYLTGQRRHDGMESWRPAVAAAVRAIHAPTPEPTRPSDAASRDVESILPALPDDADLHPQFRAGWFAAREALRAALAAPVASVDERWVMSGPVIDHGSVHAHELAAVVVDGPVGETCRLCRDEQATEAAAEFIARFHPDAIRAATPTPPVDTTLDVEVVTDAIADYYRDSNSEAQRPWQRRLAQHIAARLADMPPSAEGTE